eukprot:383222-Karenia_brevis.AAC.1
MVTANPKKYHTPIDVRKFMYRDPQHSKRYRVEHEEDADYTTTQVSLLDDARLLDAALELVAK